MYTELARIFACSLSSFDFPSIIGLRSPPKKINHFLKFDILRPHCSLSDKCSEQYQINLLCLLNKLWPLAIEKQKINFRFLNLLNVLLLN